MDTTVLSDINLWAVRVPHSSGAQRIEVDSAVSIGYLRLSEAISTELPVYVKSYGPSAVATFSVRGMGAQHTDVLWNGLSMNSPMLGLYDLNLISPSSADQIDFIYGGTSLMTGVSSFGGALNLSNKPRFQKHFDVGLFQMLGSYKTSHTDIDLSVANGRIYWRTKLAWDHSLNDFEYKNPRLPNSPTFVNEHAEVDQNQWIQETGIILNNKDRIMARLWLQETSRQLPPLMSLYSEPNQLNRSNQRDVQQRGQLEWLHQGEHIESQFRAGLSSWAIEFNDEETRAQTMQGQWKSLFSLDSLTRVESLIQYTLEQGEAEAYENDGRSQRSRGAAVLSIHRYWHQIEGDVQIKQELVGTEWAPFQYQIGAKFKYGKDERWNTRIRTAVQARYPTLNDLFWTDVDQSNLMEEHSFQNELSQSLTALWKGYTFHTTLTVYNNHIEQYILWLPQTDLSWRARNIDLVEIRGIEYEFGIVGRVGAGTLLLNTGYSFTSSKDGENKQLIFIPLHQARFRSEYQWRKFTASLNFVFQGKVYTDRANEFYMPWYQTADLRISYTTKLGPHHISGFVQSTNFTDVNYQSLPLRPMPGRMFQIGIKWRLSTE